VRRFRQGTKPEAPSPEEAREGEVEVLTSAEQLVHWDRERITQALVRETGLALAVADRIGREVEKQIIYSKTSRLTASLIRELVNAKLLEYGYTEERQRHSRLGVPLYDIEQMFLGRSEQVRPGHLEKTLSGSIIRQYALSRVVSSEVAEAHLRGDLYIHDLTEPWRVTDSIQSLEYLKKSGLCLPDFASRWASAESPLELAGQLGKFNTLLRAVVSRRTQWDGVNLFLAPLLEGASDSDLRAAARALLFETAGQATLQERIGPVMALGFYFHVPASLWKTAALGPGGRYSGKTYAYFEDTARRFLWACLELQAEGDAEGQPFRSPEFCFHLDSSFFEHAQAQEDLQRLEGLLPKLGRWCAWFHSGHSSGEGQEHFCVPESGGLTGAQCKYPWKMRSSIGPAISLNLPALALQAEGNTRELNLLLEQQIHLAFTAFRQHKQFMEGFSDRGPDCPFPLFDHRGDGEPFLRPGQQRRRLALWGLGEMARWHCGLALGGESEGGDFVQGFVDHALQEIQLTAQSCRIPCEVILEGSDEAGRMLERRLGGGNPFALDRERGANADSQPFERSAWGARLGSTQEMQLTPEQLRMGCGQDRLADALRFLFQRQREERVVVSQSFWICKACSRLVSGNPDICPRCGSLELTAVDGG
jgi:ribonucleoside-triphosphate reductase